MVPISIVDVSSSHTVLIHIRSFRFHNHEGFYLVISFLQRVVKTSAEAFRPQVAQICFTLTTRVHNPPLIPPLELPARSVVGLPDGRLWLLVGSLLAGCCQLFRSTPLFNPSFKPPVRGILFKTIKIRF